MASRSHCPDLDPGIALLDVDRSRAGGFYRLAVERIAAADGDVYWVDARNAASTYALYDLAPDERVLSGVRVARAFTAHQHYALVRRLLRAVDGDTDLIVAPNVAALYRDDDLRERERDDLFPAAVETLAALARSYGVPALVTAPGAGPLGETVREHAATELSCTSTPFGHRFVGEDFETELYRDGDGWQTTIPYWVDLLGVAERAAPAGAARRPGGREGRIAHREPTLAEAVEG